MYPEAIFSGDSNGVKSQARIWKKGLENKGFSIEELNVWDNNKLSIFDAIHIFGYGIGIYQFVKMLKNYNPNIFISPIIDSNKNLNLYKLASFVGCKKIRLFSSNYSLRLALQIVKGVCVRSNHELNYIEALSVSNTKIFKVPLSYGLNFDKVTNLPKENFCLHVSSIYQERKNVIRLIKAAKKYKFNLVLAGNKGSEVEFKPIKDEIGLAKNIQVLGFISNSKLIELSNKAKVFALPSTLEGVGIVALDAALYGANIVITNLGGPKEYYNNMAYLVSPYSVDEIGSSIVKALNENKYQPKLKNYIFKEFSEEKGVNDLLTMYQQTN